SKLVRQAGSHDTSGDDRAGPDLSHHDRNVRIRETRLMACPGLDDVAADLRLPEGGLQLRREPPRASPHLLGEAEPFGDLQAPQLLSPELARRRRPRQSPVNCHEPSGSPVTDECAVDLGEVEPFYGLPSRLYDLAFRAIAERLRRQVLTAPADSLAQVIG